MQAKQIQKNHPSYIKPKVNQSIGHKMKEGFFNFSINVAFNVTEKLNQIKHFFEHNPDNICIIGKKITSQKNIQKEVQKQLKSFIWFSYRKLPGLSKSISSDSGWGCLIRVGQMALAAGLKKYFQSFQKNKNELQIRYCVITPFLQNGGKQQKYSLKKIVQHAKSVYNKKYGEWFNVSQICSTLTSLHSSNPMKGTEDLQLIYFESGILYTSQILEKMQKKKCSCPKNNIICVQCNRDKIDDCKLLNLSIGPLSSEKKQHEYPTQSQNQSQLYQISNKKLLLFVCCQLGYAHIKEQEYRQLLSLMNIECSLGVIGGVPKKGLYFIGYQNQDLLCLDPHYVQEEANLQNLKKTYKTFECTEKRKHNRGKIDPSLAFVFYLDGLNSLKILQKAIKNLVQTYQNPILSMEQVNQFKAQKVLTPDIDGSDIDNYVENSFIEQM